MSISKEYRLFLRNLREIEKSLHNFNNYGDTSSILSNANLAIAASSAGTEI